VEECARVCYEAFRGISEQHRFPPDFPSLEFAEGVMMSLVGSASVFGVVAERDGRILGSNFVDERDEVRGIGPIAVDPVEQGSGIGRALMNAVIERTRDAESVRLLQDSFNTGSLPLYASLGFDIKEPVVVMRGRPKSTPRDAVEVKLLESADVDECSSLHRRVHGIERVNALRDALQLFSPVVARRDGQVVAYASSLFAWPVAHGVAETFEDMRSLIARAATFLSDPFSLIVPIRQAELFRWCVEEGFRVIKPMNLMVRGAYQEPRGTWFPSVLY
jgi:predicted N-acetyltransferase YhbS